MANNYMILDAVFEPYTYDSMIKPISVLNDAHNAIEDNYAKLIEESSIWERLKDSPLDKDLYDRYKAFDDAAMTAYMKFNEEGLTGNSRLDLHKIRKDYRQQIMPIVAADSARSTLIQAQLAQQKDDPSRVYERNAANIPLLEFIENPTTTYGGEFSGDTVRTTAREAFKNYEDLVRSRKSYYNNGNYVTWETLKGMTPAELEAVLNDPKNGEDLVITQLRNIINQVVDTSGSPKWENEEGRINGMTKAREQAILGLYEALGTNSYEDKAVNWTPEHRKKGPKKVVRKEKIPVGTAPLFNEAAQPFSNDIVNQLNDLEAMEKDFILDAEGMSNKFNQFLENLELTDDSGKPYSPFESINKRKKYITEYLENINKNKERISKFNDLNALISGGFIEITGDIKSDNFIVDVTEKFKKQFGDSVKMTDVGISNINSVGEIRSAVKDAINILESQRMDKDEEGNYTLENWSENFPKLIRGLEEGIKSYENANVMLHNAINEDIKKAKDAYMTSSKDFISPGERDFIEYITKHNNLMSNEEVKNNPYIISGEVSQEGIVFPSNVKSDNKTWAVQVSGEEKGNDIFELEGVKFKKATPREVFDAAVRNRKKLTQLQIEARNSYALTEDPSDLNKMYSYIFNTAIQQTAGKRGSGDDAKTTTLFTDREGKHLTSDEVNSWLFGTSKTKKENNGNFNNIFNSVYMKVSPITGRLIFGNKIEHSNQSKELYLDLKDSKGIMRNLGSSILGYFSKLEKEGGYPKFDINGNVAVLDDNGKKTGEVVPLSEFTNILLSLLAKEGTLKEVEREVWVDENGNILNQ
jgi:hypothetical protein